MHRLLIHFAMSRCDAERLKSNAVAASSTAQNQEEVAGSRSDNEPSRLELTSSSKVDRAGHIPASSSVWGSKRCSALSLHDVLASLQRTSRKTTQSDIIYI